MPIAHETVVFDVDDFKVAPLTADSGASPTYGASVDVPGIADVTLDKNIVSAALKGDSRTIARKGRLDTIGASCTIGKVDIDFLNVVLQGTLTDSGATPNQQARFQVKGSNSLPYFRASFLIDDVDTGLGGLRVVMYKCAVTGGTLLTASSDDFGQPTIDFEAIPPESSDVLFDIFLDETRVAL